LKKITLSSSYNFTSGYAQVLETLLDGLTSLNYNVMPRTYSSVSDRFKKYFDRDISFDSQLDLLVFNIVNEFSIGNPYVHINFDRPRILLTMWESTRINDLLIEVLNKFNCIIVPNWYNKNNLIKQGCTTRIEVVPLFCDTEFYFYKSHFDYKDFTFGISNEDPRKNLNKVQTCFLKAFSNNKNVKLCIKTSKQTEIIKTINSNIELCHKLINKNELRDWYHNLDVYVSGVTCEGWGMMQQESMCCGRPIIYTKYGGLLEFVNEQHNYPIEFKEVPARHFWGDHGGKWSEFNELDMIEKMLYCYKNRDEVKQKGYLASKHASQFTKERFLKKIDSVLSEYL
jgi:glycosyltransferase involved in cell wall biosynthesis